MIDLVMHMRNDNHPQSKYKGDSEFNRNEKHHENCENVPAFPNIPRFVHEAICDIFCKNGIKNTRKERGGRNRLSVLYRDVIIKM